MQRFKAVTLNHQYRFGSPQQDVGLDYPRQRPMHFLFINYFADSQGEAITPNEEIAEWAWVLPEEALYYPLNNITRTLIEGYLASSSG
ncbi:NUDIX domain-containing protein, partial [Candidatus Hakubella thermalkaliphila]